MPSVIPADSGQANIDPVCVNWTFVHQFMFATDYSILLLGYITKTEITCNNFQAIESSEVPKVSWPF